MRPRHGLLPPGAVSLAVANTVPELKGVLLPGYFQSGLSVCYKSETKVTFHILIHWNASLFWFLWNFQTFQYCWTELHWMHLHALSIWIGKSPKTKVLGAELPCPKAIFCCFLATNGFPWSMAGAGCWVHKTWSCGMVRPGLWWLVPWLNRCGCQQPADGAESKPSPRCPSGNL